MNRQAMGLLMLTALLLGSWAGHAAAPAKAQLHTVTISQGRYTPANLTIRAGDTVTWVNGDDRDHTVVAADGKSFASGNIRPGSSFSTTFRKAGNYPYGCQLHPRMRAQITVQ